MSQFDEEEVWASLEDIGFPEYVISNYGNVRNFKRGSYVQISATQQGVAKVGLFHTGSVSQHTLALAPLVALAFIPLMGPKFDTPINLDGDRMNCAVYNLAWRPLWFAVKYHKQFNIEPQGYRAPIVEVNTSEEFPTSWEAAIKYGLLDRSILLAILNETSVFPTDQQFEPLDVEKEGVSNGSRKIRGL